MRKPNETLVDFLRRQGYSDRYLEDHKETGVLHAIDNLNQPLYVSFEQEAIVQDVTTCKPPESAKQGRFDYGYVTVSLTPWGHEGPDWKPFWIGPVHDNDAEEAVNSVVALLKMLQCRVIRAGEELGEWGCGIYKPHPSEY